MLVRLLLAGASLTCVSFLGFVTASSVTQGMEGVVEFQTPSLHFGFQDFKKKTVVLVSPPQPCSNYTIYGGEDYPVGVFVVDGACDQELMAFRANEAGAQAFMMAGRRNMTI